MWARVVWRVTPHFDTCQDKNYLQLHHITPLSNFYDYPHLM